MNKSNEFLGISEYQLYLYNEGTNYKSNEFLGCHKYKGKWRFSVWAPNAQNVYLTGTFNDWHYYKYPLTKISTTGVWVGCFNNVNEGDLYKYVIEKGEKVILKSDPYAISFEEPPKTASIVEELQDFCWEDQKWIEKRQNTAPYDKPILIYEMHLGSWIKDNNKTLSYRELADKLCDYLIKYGYTHVEFMPICEYPYEGSWGYQVTGFFAPTKRYGGIEDLKYLINKLHKKNIGVILDWVCAHFPKDEHGLYMFDTTPAYEYSDAKMAEHKEWGTMVFDYSKGEVVSFLMSSCYYWINEFHFDGIRVDAVSAMLYRDYSRKDGEWSKNKYGGNENLEAIAFFQKLNSVVFNDFPNILMIAEESTSWAKVTYPVNEGGLGFNFKWNMGWMNDTLEYFKKDPLFRKGSHSLLTFLLCYAFSENYILPFSHDEVVHGKHSLIDKIFGNYEEKFMQYRALLAYYMALPGKKLMFMGGEFGQFLEWRYKEQLEWNILDIDKNRNLSIYVKNLNHFYKKARPFWKIDRSWDGFSWINPDDKDNSVISFIRKSKKDYIIILSNFTPVKRKDYKLGVTENCDYEVIFSSSEVEEEYKINFIEKEYCGFPYHITININGYQTLYIKKKKVIVKCKNDKLWIT